jgi:hypothetical protein
MTNPILYDSGIMSPQSIFEVSSTQEHRLGQKAYFDDGVFYYARSSGAAINRAASCRYAAPTANHVSIVPAASVAAGATQITVTLGATSAAANLYKDGVIVVIDGTEIGQRRKIKEHTSGSASGSVTLTLYDAFEYNVATADEVSLLPNRFADVVVTPGDALVPVAGVPQCYVPPGSTTPQYFWIQTAGYGMWRGDGSTFALGNLVTVATATTDDAGQCTLLSFVSSTAAQNHVIALGQVVALGDAASDGDARYVDLWIAR